MKRLSVRLMLILDCLREPAFKDSTKEVHERIIDRLGRSVSFRTTQRNLNTLKAAGAAGVEKRSGNDYWFKHKVATSIDRIGQLHADQAINLVLLLEHGARFGMKAQVEGLNVLRRYAEAVLLEATAENDWSSKRLTSSTRFMALQPADIDQQVLKLVQDALVDNRVIKVSYRVPERGDLMVDYVLQVMGLSFQDANIYASCRVIEERWPNGHQPPPQAPRHKYESNGVSTLSVLQLHRFQTVTMLREDAQAVADYNINAPQVRKDLLSLYSTEPTELRLRLTFNLYKRLSENRLSSDQVITQDGPDAWTLTCRVADGQGLRLWLLSNADQIEVLGPAHLRRHIRDCLRDALAAYDDEPD